MTTEGRGESEERREICRCEAVNGFVGQQRDFEFDMKLNREPKEQLEIRSNGINEFSGNKTSR